MTEKNLPNESADETLASMAFWHSYLTLKSTGSEKLALQALNTSLDLIERVYGKELLELVLPWIKVLMEESKEFSDRESI